MHFIDVSEYQGDINWKKVRLSGITAAYLKASEGVHWQDPKFLENRKAANASGVHVGAYHFADLYDGALEAKHFLDVIKLVDVHDLKPVLDLETNAKKLKPAFLEEFAKSFNTVVKSRTGVIPMFYSYAGFIEGMNLSKPLGNGLWIAAYGRNDGVEHPVYAPAPWKKYTAHQFASTATVAGINGKVDISNSPNGLRPLLAHPTKNALSNL